MDSDADLGTNAVPSVMIASPNLYSPELGEGSFMGDVLAVGDLPQEDQQIWQRFLAHQPAAFLSFPYVCALASHYPLVRVTRISAPDGRTVAFFNLQYSLPALAMATAAPLQLEAMAPAEAARTIFILRFAAPRSR